MKDAKQIWAKLLEVAEPLLSAQTVEIWLSPCRALRMEGDMLVVGLDNEFRGNKIRENYQDILEECMVRNNLGQGIILEVMSQSPQEVKPLPPEPRTIGPNGLNPQYLFSSFVVGKSNRFTHAASMAVAERPGENYNPLFIWGGVGLGKTHLMHAIGNHALGKNPATKVAYLSSEKFMNELISAIKNGRTAEFRSKYRHVDILLIDDIQFLAGKESTQEEFFHTFNELHTAKKHIVLSSDRPPKELGGIEERIVSRFEWGLVTDIGLPDYETRIAILKKKAEMRNVPVNDDVILFLANNIPSNIRELEGALNRVIAQSNFTEEPITVENAQEWLKDVIVGSRRGPLTFKNILEVVAAEFGFSVEDILGKRRTAEVALARQAAMYICRNNTEASLQQIAKDFGKKDHTTVLHALKKIETLRKEDNRINRIVENIEKKL